jgi:Ser/Thr protein kinase RdoA (MazF antagonist)
MRLSTMWRVDRAVTRDGRNPVAGEIARRWKHRSGSVRFFRSSANFVYSLRANGPCFLRFADETERSRTTIEAEVDLLNRLAGAGVPVARPVPSLLGNLVETVSTDRGTYNACVFPALSGAQHEIEALDPAQFRSWGAALGRLHAAIHTYPNSRSSAHPSWEDRLLAVGAYLDDGGPVARERERVAAALAEVEVTNGNYGLVHSDFELDNLFWNGEVSGIIDFDECTRDWYAADIASALRDRFPRGFDPADEAFLAFVEGYRRHFELDADSLSALPTFIRFGALLLFGKVARALDLPGDEEYPDWLLGLGRKLEGRMDAYTRSLGPEPFESPRT